MKFKLTGTLCLSCVLLLILMQGTVLALKGPVKGRVPPEIIGESTTGAYFKLTAQKGKPLLISFFTFSCKHCKKEIPKLANIERKNPWVDVVCVNAEFRRTNDVKAFISKLSDAPKTIICGNEMLKEAYNLYGFPYTFFVDENGRFVDGQPGPVDLLLNRLGKANPLWLFTE